MSGTISLTYNEKFELELSIQHSIAQLTELKSEAEAFSAREGNSEYYRFTKEHLQERIDTLNVLLNKVNNA